MIKIIYLKEYIGSEPSRSNSLKQTPVVLKEARKHTGVSSDSIMVDVEGIHSVLTNNYTYYTPQALYNSCKEHKWTTPYERPVIMHHNDEDGVIIGRIKKSKFKNKTDNTEYPGIVYTLNIPHKEGKAGIEDGRLLTTSVGVTGYDVKCSVCGTNIAEEPCGHERGCTYDGKLCYWIINDFEPKEISYVIVPSDPYAKNIKTYPANEYNKKMLLAESENNKNEEVNALMFDDIEKQIKAQLKESETKTESQLTESEEVKDIEEKVEELKESDAASTEIEEEEKSEIKEEVEVKKEDELSEETKEQETEKEPEDDKKEKEEASEEVNKDDLARKILELEDIVSSLKEDLKIEKGQKEVLEKELKEFKKEKKNSLVEKANTLRKELDLDEMEESFVNACSIELIESTINNYNEILNARKVNANNISNIQSEMIVDDKKDPAMKKEKKLSEKEEKRSNTSLEEQLNNFLKL